jgi:hypothetical protein
LKLEEKTAETFFKSIGYENIIFEPKGKRTPDFSLNDNIGIEVRRLNQFHNGKPIENESNGVIRKIINQIQSFGNKKHSKSALFTLRYSRPINYNIEIKKKINSILEDHYSQMDFKIDYKINNYLNLSIFPSLEKFDMQFHLGMLIDYNRGGFVLGNIYQSLKIIIPEKFNKIKPYKHEYSEWWLALVDTIGYGLSGTEFDQLRSCIDFDLKFDRVFIISYLDPFRGGEI